MGDVVNLNRFRKSRDRQERARTAEENRTKFGRNKQDRTRLKIESSRDATDHEGKLLEDKSRPEKDPEAD